MSELNDNAVATSTHVLGDYAAKNYLQYAMSVVQGRALPDVCDGQKPVQRRILYAMHEMGLYKAPKHVKSARVVGDVIGKLHPHGDSAVYEAMVRMAQDWTLRYPLVDGQGNFGSRDGDGAAAMRYTECRLNPIAELLLAEIDKGTVDFRPNYDGAFREPALLPARLPFVLLNGASGIAVGMATEIPSHNLREVAAAARLLVLNPETTPAEIAEVLPAPDFPGGGQIISSPSDIAEAYRTGRGSLRVRARWTVEPLARGQWRIAVTELPPGVSCAQVATEIEACSNPQPKEKGGKKIYTPEQTHLKAAFLAAIDEVRDESGKDHAVRLVIEPKSSRQEPEELMKLLLAHTSLERNASINLTMIGSDGRPATKSLWQILREWADFRVVTVRRRSQHRLDEVERRLHILEGRQAVLLNIDEVIRVIRESDDPKADLMAAFKLSEIQAEDILEIRLRQLARLEAIKIEREMAQLRTERDGLRKLLSDEGVLRTCIADEIAADAQEYGDVRRTLIEVAERVTASEAAVTVDEPVTILVSKNGWLRARQGHGVDRSALSWREGDSELAVIETRSVWPLIVLDTQGRAYTLKTTEIPGGRGDGVPLTKLVELQDGGKLAYVLGAAPESRWVFAGSGAYGFISPLDNLVARNRTGKTFLTVDAGEVPVAPQKVEGNELAVLTSKGRLLVFPLADLRELGKGKGLQMLKLEAGDALTAVRCGDFAQIQIVDPKGKVRKLEGATLESARGKRASKGLQLPSRQAVFGELVNRDTAA